MNRRCRTKGRAQHRLLKRMPKTKWLLQAEKICCYLSTCRPSCMKITRTCSWRNGRRYCHSRGCPASKNSSSSSRLTSSFAISQLRSSSQLKWGWVMSHSRMRPKARWKYPSRKIKALRKTIPMETLSMRSWELFLYKHWGKSRQKNSTSLNYSRMYPCRWLRLAHRSFGSF